ncbi:hypothetical protein CHUAL_009827 [Chamberlinius hualienensis]
MVTLLRQLNDGFSFLVFAWLAFEVFTIAFLFRGLTMMPIEHKDFGKIASSLFVSIALFMSKALVISNINDKIMTSLDSVHQILMKMREDVEDEEHVILTKFEEEFHRYCLQMSMHTPSISGWGYFTINKPLIISVGGAIFSYILLLYNIN